MTERDERPGAGEDEEKAAYTISEAAEAICGLEKDDIGAIAAISDDEFEFLTSKVLPSLESLFRDNLYFNKERCRIELGGYDCRNPFNQDDGTRAAFPKIAYYRVWRETPSGMICPQWFRALHDADFEETSGEELAPGKHAPNDFLEHVDFWAPDYNYDRGTQFKDESEAAAFFGKVLARVERKQKAMANEAPPSGFFSEAVDLARSISAPASGRGPESEAGPAEVICDGLTVEAVRGVLADYPALADVIAAAAEVRGFPDGRNKSATAIVANINRRIKKRAEKSGEQWGRAPDKSGALSKEQTSAFKSLFETQNGGGRPVGTGRGPVARKPAD